jgi:hypothetical protein
LVDIRRALPHPRRIALFLVVVETVLVAWWVRSGWLRSDIGAAFRETGMATTVSDIHLVLLAIVCFAIFRSRARTTGRWSGHAVWLAGSLGFVYLALDEAFMFHERIDMAIHAMLGIVETPLTDRLDDLVVGLYGVIGLAVILLNRREMLRYRSTNAVLAVGFILLALSVLMDAFTNDALPAFADDWHLSRWTHRRLMVVEEVAKLFAEAAVMVALYGYLYCSVRSGGTGKAVHDDRTDLGARVGLT